ncbi:heavy metal translocating P-type ATPase [Eubacteriales bacterium OttesenSCG-928-G02]|nr:heavy metal translocating P-type ATPase [Eubacteriales bacterium OttesenSCG-928-G02]
MLKNNFSITGMTCSACSSRIEKALDKSNGIKSVSVNLLKNNMSVQYDEKLISPEDIISIVENTGYGAVIEGNNKIEKSKNNTDNQLKAVKQRLIVSFVFTVPLFYIAMGEMWHLPMPSFLIGTQNAMIFALTQLLLVIPVLIAGGNYFKIGFKNLIKLSPNMDSLIALGSGASFLYSIYALFKIAYGLGYNDIEMAHHFSMNLYFESSAMILTLITLGKYFEARAKNKTTNAITKLMDLTPKTSTVIRNDIEMVIPTEELLVGDILLIKAGDIIPVDGILKEGYSSVDESAITGESIPVEKFAGDKLTGGTISKSGFIKMQATAVGADTTISKIIKLVDEATSSKAPIAKLADKISGIFVPLVIGIAVIAFIVWLAVGKTFEFSLSVAVSVLVISCPCALGLASPTAIMVGTGKGALNGILIKSAEAIETAHSIDTVVMDKTGTVTEGKPVIFHINAEESEHELLTVAAALEKKSGHPLAEPIISAAVKAKLFIPEVEEFKITAGLGISGTIEGKMCIGGNRRFMQENNIALGEYIQTEEAYAHEGKIPLYFAKDNNLLGIIALADTVKPTSKEAVNELKQMGLNVIMLTGDNKNTAEFIKNQLGFNEVIAQVMPDEKEAHIRALQTKGQKVAMVGDGINDAPALVRADIGIAVGAGTDIAIDSADIVLVKSDPLDIVSMIKLSRAVIRNIKQNLFWAFLYNIIGIPIAAGVLYAGFDILLNPMIAAAAMSFSSVSVVLNALRLQLFTPKFKVNKNITEKENFNMKKIIKIEGMNCGHCTASVEKALSGIDGVISVQVDLMLKQAEVELNSNVSDKTLEKVISDIGFSVLKIL